MAALEDAYGQGTRVVGIQLDEDAAPPRNLARRAIVTFDPGANAAMVRRWRDELREQSALPWISRIRRALTTDRDARR